MSDIFANIFFCEEVEDDKISLDAKGIFSNTPPASKSEELKGTPFTILINATVYGEIKDEDKGKSLYYILEAREEKGKRYKLLKEVKLTEFNELKENVIQNNTAFVFPNRNLIANIGEYFVRVYCEDSSKTTRALLSSSTKKIINSQMLIVED